MPQLSRRPVEDPDKTVRRDRARHPHFIVEDFNAPDARELRIDLLLQCVRFTAPNLEALAFDEPNIIVERLLRKQSVGGH